MTNVASVISVNATHCFTLPVIILHRPHGDGFIVACDRHRFNVSDDVRFTRGDEG